MQQPSNYNEADTDYQFSDALKRRATHTGEKRTIATIVKLAKAGG